MRAEQHIQTGKARIVTGMNFAEYVNIRAVNISTLLYFAEGTPEGAHWKITHPEDDTAATLRGHAAHAAILEPDTFHALYAKMPNFGDCRVTANKKARQEWVASHDGFIILGESEYDACCAMRDRLAATASLAELFDGPGQNELTLLWQDKETGLDCKSRLDRITAIMGWQTLIDVKTARAITDNAVSRAIADYNYHTRFAWYIDALSTIHESSWRSVIVWICSAEPYEMRAMEFDDEPLEEGRAAYRHYLAKYAKCIKDNHWPSYPAGFEIMELPRYAYRFTTPDRI